MEISWKNSNKDDFWYLASCYYDLSICCGMCKYRRELHFSCVDGCYLSDDSSPDIINETLGVKSKKKIF